MFWDWLWEPPKLKPCTKDTLKSCDTSGFTMIFELIRKGGPTAWLAIEWHLKIND